MFRKGHEINSPENDNSQDISQKQANEEKQRLINDELLGLYWKPVYCYLRRKGYDNETSKDMTQGFFSEIVLGRELISQADKKKGKFRTFLLTALDRYVIDLHRKQSSSIRKPQGDILKLDDIDIPCCDHQSPEEEFNHAWVAELLEKTLSEVRQECEQTNKEVHWAVFEAKVLTPVVEGTKPPSMASLCKEYGIETPTQASNMIVTVKRRLKKQLERNIRNRIKNQEPPEEPPPTSPVKPSPKPPKGPLLNHACVELLEKTLFQGL